MEAILPVLKMIGGILVAILAFGIMIFIHELGHFMAAKQSGVKVNEFSIGMGPALLKRQRGETLYALRAIPFGGFVAMEGEDNDSEDNHSFGRASLPRRALIMLSGAMMNLLLGILIIFILSAMMPAYGTTEIATFLPGAVTNQWLQEGDNILRVNGKRTRTYNDIFYHFTRDRDGSLDFLVERDGQEVLLDGVQFEMEEIEENYKIIQLDFQFQGKARTLGGVFAETISETKRMSKTIWSSLQDLVTGQVGLNQLSGPVGITKQIGEMSSSGNWKVVLEFIAMISINLGIVNLLPLPALDGGRIVLLLLEAIRGKKINQKVEMYINGIGLLLLLGLMAIVTFKDIVKLF